MKLPHGSWVPAVLDPRDIVTIKLILCWIALIRAFDYASSGIEEQHYASLESVLPQYVWALACLACGLLLAFGMLFRARQLMWFGHAVGFVVYATLAAAAAQYAFAHTPPDEFRRIGPLALVAWMHAIIAIRAGRHPRPAPCRVIAAVKAGGGDA